MLIRFVFFYKAQIDMGSTSGLKQFEVLDRIDYEKGTNNYNFNIVPRCGNTTQYGNITESFLIL